MKRVTLLLVLFTLGISVSHAQDVTYVDTTSDSTSDITSTNTNTNNNTKLDSSVIYSLLIERDWWI